MSSKSKKRKTTDSASTAHDGTLSKTALRNKLYKCHKPTIADTLLESLRHASPDQVRVVQSLLAPLLVMAATPLHCVRCHEEYFESANHDSMCQIEHMEGTTMCAENHNGMHDHTFPCCGLEVEVEGDGDFMPRSDEEYCFRGPHTTDPDEVDYYDPGAGEECGNIDVRPCSEMGCGV